MYNILRVGDTKGGMGEKAPLVERKPRGEHAIEDSVLILGELAS